MHTFIRPIRLRTSSLIHSIVFTESRGTMSQSSTNEVTKSLQPVARFSDKNPPGGLIAVTFRVGNLFLSMNPKIVAHPAPRLCPTIRKVKCGYFA